MVTCIDDYASIFSNLNSLNDLGFAWNAYDVRWRMRYEELKEYVELNGMGTIPTMKTNKRLRTWINHQRKLYRVQRDSGEKNSLTKERINALNELGFLWDP